ncbi:methyl-accepting chemotaxis protein [Trichlorobacter lovleyi]|uniref:methyl-accepting chemotaxis protein n=1 Tax=Trichlorobacter lovleyi TaxID=313985 RepID=UPI0023F26C67|nr:nitrate- and nitrite sensing domain-containing protein [Trichlorobacter lovleyi]
MLKNVTIRTKLLLLLLLPVLGLLFFSGREMLDKYAAMQALTKTEHLVGLSVRTGALVHELQKERGLSSGFINAKGEKFKDDLFKQRQLTDEQVKQLASYIVANPDAADVVKAALDAAAKQKEKLQEIRSKVDGLNIEGKDSFAFYTAINYSYLDVVAAVGRNSQNPDLMRSAISYFAFSKVKEEMGKERATLNAVIADNSFNPETYQRIFAILSAQRSFMEGFRKFGSDTAVALYDSKEHSEQFKKVDELRNAVLAKGMDGNFGIEAPVWFSAITAKIELMKSIEDGLALEILQQAQKLNATARTTLILSVSFSCVMGALTLLLSLLIVSSITSPLKSLVEMLQDIAQGEGDLTRRLETGRKDEFGEVASWFNRFVDNIHSIISQASNTTVQVATASNQLQSTAEQIATAAEEVACQTATVATASEEMSATSNDISRNCSMASDIANRASEMANNGAEVVQETLRGMEQIADKVRESAHTVEALGARSDQIGAIVGTIEDIADQTNLLALNAAIEAARAGEQGRGFAVVADEVRALAERTTRATREIGEMIKAIQQETGGAVSSMEQGVAEVERGMDSSRRSGEALQLILEGINEVTMQVHQIAAAAEEQTAVTGEISTNIHQITDVVQQTANGAHETADAASMLSKLSNDLEGLVGRFKL